MRHELKYVLSPIQYQVLKKRLVPFLEKDANAGENGEYFIRSIYFDSMEMSALAEKNAGIESRKKYRIRFYNGDSSLCKLECKIKKGTRIEKKVVKIGEYDAKLLVAGNANTMRITEKNVCGDLNYLVNHKGYMPKVVVDYVREAYVYSLSDVRITFDKELASGAIQDCWTKERFKSNIFDRGYVVLEVKYNEFIPTHISDIIASVKPVQSAVSKYVLCMNKQMEESYEYN